MSRLNTPISPRCLADGDATTTYKSGGSDATPKAAAATAVEETDLGSVGVPEAGVPERRLGSALEAGEPASCCLPRARPIDGSGVALRATGVSERADIDVGHRPRGAVTRVIRRDWAVFMEARREADCRAARQSIAPSSMTLTSWS
jgi:hypothetical protein